MKDIFTFHYLNGKKPRNARPEISVTNDALYREREVQSYVTDIFKDQSSITLTGSFILW
jgi:hypothetical protein